MVHARRVDDVRMSGMVAFKRLLRRTFCVRLGSQAAIERPLLAPLLVSPKYEIQRSKSVEQARRCAELSTEYEAPRASYEPLRTLSTCDLPLVSTPEFEAPSTEPAVPSTKYAVPRDRMLY
jgi:hypothetical protein